MNAKELLERYAKGERDFSGADLDGANLDGASLYGADLSGAYLSGASLAGASLRAAELYGANLSGTILSGADLRGAELRGADLSWADMKGVRLYGANLDGANFSCATLLGADLDGGGGVTCPDGRVWSDYTKDPLAEICQEPEARKRAIDAWGKTTWFDCPMHEAYGWCGNKDVPKELRIAVDWFIAVHDAGLLPVPGGER